MRVYLNQISLEKVERGEPRRLCIEELTRMHDNFIALLRLEELKLITFVPDPSDRSVDIPHILKPQEEPDSLIQLRNRLIGDLRTLYYRCGVHGARSVKHIGPESVRLGAMITSHSASQKLSDETSRRYVAPFIKGLPLIASSQLKTGEDFTSFIKKCIRHSPPQSALIFDRYLIDIINDKLTSLIYLIWSLKRVASDAGSELSEITIISRGKSSKQKRFSLNSSLSGGGKDESENIQDCVTELKSFHKNFKRLDETLKIIEDVSRLRIKLYYYLIYEYRGGVYEPHDRYIVFDRGDVVIESSRGVSWDNTLDKQHNLKNKHYRDDNGEVDPQRVKSFLRGLDGEEIIKKRFMMSSSVNINLREDVFGELREFQSHLRISEPRDLSRVSLSEMNALTDSHLIEVAALHDAKLVSLSR